MHVTLLSIFRRVKTVLSSRKSRVFSRTRFQSLNRKLMTAGPTQNNLQGSFGPASFKALISRGARVKGSRKGVI